MKAVQSALEPEPRAKILNTPEVHLLPVLDEGKFIPIEFEFKKEDHPMKFKQPSSFPRKPTTLFLNQWTHSGIRGKRDGVDLRKVIEGNLPHSQKYPVTSIHSWRCKMCTIICFRILRATEYWWFWQAWRERRHSVCTWDMCSSPFSYLSNFQFSCQKQSSQSTSLWSGLLNTISPQNPFWPITKCMCIIERKGTFHISLFHIFPHRKSFNIFN